MDPVPVDLKQLIDKHKRGRSVEALGRHVGKSGNTVRGWASGKYPTPEFQAVKIAEWLGVDEATVLAAAEESRRGALVGTVVSGSGQPLSHEQGARRGEELVSSERADISETLARVGAQLVSLGGELVALGERVAAGPPASDESTG
jgi:hypothetical protein